MAFPKLIIISDRQSCASFGEWAEQSMRLVNLLESLDHFGVQIRHKGLHSVPEMTALTALLDPHEHLWINGGFRGFKSHYPFSIQPAQNDQGFGFYVHSTEEARAAIKGGAAYLQAGPIFNPFSKPILGVGTALLKSISLLSTIPVVAVGGMTPERSAECVLAGADAVATISCLRNAIELRLDILKWIDLIAVD